MKIYSINNSDRDIYSMSLKYFTCSFLIYFLEVLLFSVAKNYGPSLELVNLFLRLFLACLAFFLYQRFIFSQVKNFHGKYILGVILNPLLSSIIFALGINSFDLNNPYYIKILSDIFTAIIVYRFILLR